MFTKIEPNSSIFGRKYFLHPIAKKGVDFGHIFVYNKQALKAQGIHDNEEIAKAG